MYDRPATRVIWPDRHYATNARRCSRATQRRRAPLRDLDGVIMNAPFTDNRKRSRKFGAETVKRMQRHELEIRDRLLQRDPGAGGVITTNSIRTFFTPLADRLLRSEEAFLAKVLPVTACTGASGLAERRFLSERFHVERIVTTHDPRRIAFSENTTIHESLLICRRRPKEGRPPTEFVSLRRMPDSAREAIEAADAIVAGRAGGWGSTVSWPADRVQAGDWTPVQWYDGGLASTIWEIEQSPLLEPVGLRYAVGPAGRRIQDAYVRCDPDAAGALPGFHSVSSRVRRTMLAEPDVWYRPRPDKEHLARRYAERRSRLLVAMRMNTVSGRLNGLWTRTPAFGWWVPVTADDDRRARALALWWNATPARLLLLNRRAQTLTYPTWQLQHLEEVRIPRPENPAWDTLAEAWEQVHDQQLLPMRDAENCPVRRVIDAAAAVVLGVSENEVADWRRRLAVEPTIKNARARRPGEGRET